MLDLVGHTISIGKLEEEEVKLEKDSKLFISKEEIVGNSSKIWITPNKILANIQLEQEVLLNERSILAEVVDISSEGLTLLIKNDGVIKEGQDVNFVRFSPFERSTTERDEDDIINFGLKENFDFIAIPCCHSKANVDYARDLLGPRGSHIKIVAKIEDSIGLRNCDSIVASADGIFIGRGDLGLELGVKKLMTAQKFLIERANIAGKPIITANQLLYSMVEMPFPTRAEVTDVCNAIYDGTDCVTLSAETALGEFPVECVRTMADVFK